MSDMKVSESSLYQDPDVTSLLLLKTIFESSVLIMFCP